MPGLGPGIHANAAVVVFAWMAGSAAGHDGGVAAGWSGNDDKSVYETVRLRRHNLDASPPLL
jgi:hypothetical protein